ncbi:MAG: hypothetical protein ACWA5W_06745 [Phycisphaerales bacterium]
MRVLILIDAQFAIHERALIERVVVGLANEGISAQIVLPKGRSLEDAGFDILTEPIYYADRGLAFSRSIRASQIAKQVVTRLGGSDEAQTEGLIDIVHVFGGSAWAMGRELAQMLDAGMVLEVWRSGLIESAKGLGLEAHDRALLSVPEHAFEDELMNAGLGKRIVSAPWGAHVDQDVPQIFRPDKDISAVLMSSGRQRDQAVAAFEGVIDAIEQRPEVMIFANVELVERASLWKRVKERSMESRFTVIDRSEDRRDLLLRCDILLYPDTLHEERTLLIDAMGAAMAVIAGNDEMVAPIQESHGVQTVDRPTRASWSKAVDSCLSDLDASRSMGEDARAYVKKYRRNGQHIASIVDAYHHVCTHQDATNSPSASERITP